MSVQIYEILKSFKLSTHKNPFFAVSYKFRHNFINIKPLDEECKTNMKIKSLMFDIYNELPHTHYSDINYDWIERSMTIVLSFDKNGAGMGSQNFYDTIELMLKHSILFRLSKRGKYLVNPYILNVLSQAQAEHIISTVAHGTVQVS